MRVTWNMHTCIFWGLQTFRETIEREWAFPMNGVRLSHMSVKRAVLKQVASAVCFSQSAYRYSFTSCLTAFLEFPGSLQASSSRQMLDKVLFDKALGSLGSGPIACSLPFSITTSGLCTYILLLPQESVCSCPDPSCSPLSCQISELGCTLI